MCFSCGCKQLTYQSRRACTLYRNHVCFGDFSNRSGLHRTIFTSPEFRKRKQPIRTQLPDFPILAFSFVTGVVSYSGDGGGCGGDGGGGAGSQRELFDLAVSALFDSNLRSGFRCQSEISSIK
mmetsp:Transcript_23257/g.34458  ORF Transcript_23257/g.34458 Transcript_23257/m.34458 type:complete len:123 (+) Transcript_23257:927-1295(+)